MNTQFTQFLAVWGAVVSTIALLWQIFQWTRANPRIAAKVQMNESHSSASDDWISFELRNRGGKPTTIEEIMFVDHESWWSRLAGYPNRIENIYVSHKSTMPLPIVLDPGEVWKGTCPLDEEYERGGLGRTRRQRFEVGQLFYRIRCAHTDRLISGRVAPERVMERM